MKARLLSKILNTKRDITNQGDYIAIASGLCHNLISVDKKTLKVKYALDTFNQGRAAIKNEELTGIWDKLHQLISTGQIKDIIEGKDEIENPITIFTVEDGKLIKTYTDKYEFPNIDIDGYRIYQDTHFLTKGEAIKEGIEDYKKEIKYTSENRLKQLQEELDEVKSRISSRETWIAHLKTLLK